MRLLVADLRRASGFTLIELVIVMLIISVGLLGLASLFSNTSKALSTNEILQQAAQYAQECAERVIAVRRDLGFASTSINNNMCDVPPPPSTFGRQVTVGALYSGGGASPCPSGTNNCKNVLITVANAAVSSSITVMLVDY